MDYDTPSTDSEAFVPKSYNLGDWRGKAIAVGLALFVIFTIIILVVAYA